MGPNEKQKIEIEKLHRDPLPPLNQAVKADYSDFLGTALDCYLRRLGCIKPHPRIRHRVKGGTTKWNITETLRIRVEPKPSNS